MSLVDDISAILKNEACKIDGVAAAITDPQLGNYLRKTAAMIIDEANSITDHLTEKLVATKTEPQSSPDKVEGETRQIKPLAPTPGDLEWVRQELGTSGNPSADRPVTLSNGSAEQQDG